MSRIITFSRQYPSYHPKRGQSTYFVEMIQNSLCSMNLPMYDGIDPPLSFLDSLTKQNVGYKHHTIRAGHRWKSGDWFKPVVWGTDINPKSGRSGPYHSKQITFAPDIHVQKTWDIDIHGTDWYLDGRHEYTTGWSISKEAIAGNDGLSFIDFCDWFTLSPDFKKKQEFFGQIICWNENINY